LNPLPAYSVDFVEPDYAVNTQSVPVADLDADGDLELACVNYNKMYTYDLPATAPPSGVEWPQAQHDASNSRNYQAKVRDLYVRGDANDDGVVTITDVIVGLGYLFLSVSTDCLAAIDANRDWSVNVADPMYLLLYLFPFGPPPPLPFPDCRDFPAIPVLSCERTQCP
jgi:hypothetical protein